MATHSRPHPEPSPGGTPASTRSVLELARIYVSASACSSALDTLERLPLSQWDEEARLLRAEALIGLGRLPEAESLLGPTTLPTIAMSSARAREAKSIRPERAAGTSDATGAASLEVEPAEGGSARPLLPRNRGRERRRTQSRREKMALWRFLLQLRILHRTDRYREVLQYGRAFFSHRGVAPSLYVARIATVMAQATLAMRRPAEARELYEEVLDLYRHLRSKEGVADTLLGMANTQLLDCRWDEADALYQEARYRYEEMGQSDKALACQINLGILRSKRGDLTAGRALLSQSMQRAAEMGEKRRMPTIHLGLGLIEMRCGMFGEARQHLLTALRSGRCSNSPRTRALALEYLGEMYLYMGRIRRARRCLKVALKVARSIAPAGDLVFEIRRRQAEAALADRSYDEARALALESLQGAREFGDAYEAATAEGVLAAIDEATGRLDRGLELLLAAAETLDRLGETFERARLEVQRMRLEHRMGRLSASAVRQRLPRVRRGYETLPASPVARDAEALGATMPDVDPPKGPRVAVSERMAASNPVHETSLLSPQDREKARSLGLIGDSAELQDALVLARLASSLAFPVLLVGEPGSGKSQLARLMHAWSGREGNFLSFRCANLSEAVLATELFGNGRGVSGLLDAARRGTLFLDEVFDLPRALQSKLVSWLDENFPRGPESSEPLSEVRIVAATRHGVADLARAATLRASLDQVLQAGQTPSSIRDDLRRHLSRVIVVMPPLRGRMDDVPQLIRHYVEVYCRRFGLEPISMPQSTLDRFTARRWPGNLRELQTAVEEWVEESAGVSNVVVPESERGVDRAITSWPADEHCRTLERLDLEAVRLEIVRSGWDLGVAAAALGVSRGELFVYLSQKGVRKPRGESAS